MQAQMLRVPTCRLFKANALRHLTSSTVSDRSRDGVLLRQKQYDMRWPTSGTIATISHLSQCSNAIQTYLVLVAILFPPGLNSLLFHVQTGEKDRGCVGTDPRRVSASVVAPSAYDMAEGSPMMEVREGDGGRMVDDRLGEVVDDGPWSRDSPIVIARLVLSSVGSREAFLFVKSVETTKAVAS